MLNMISPQNGNANREMRNTKNSSLHIKNNILPPTHRASVTVNRVGSRITQAANKFIKENKPNESIGGPYTYTVIRSDQANAFVLPNNHIFVFTGLFKFVKIFIVFTAIMNGSTLRCYSYPSVAVCAVILTPITVFY